MLATSYKSLLGCVESLPKGVQFAALRCVVKYLRSVRSSRGVKIFLSGVCKIGVYMTVSR